MKEGWYERQMKSVAEDVAGWPAWMREAAGLNKEKKVPAIRCPHCGYEGGDDPKLDLHGGASEDCVGFYYLEDVVVWRSVVKVTEGGIVVDGLYRTGEGYDDGRNPRLECRRCLNEFDLPKNEDGLDITVDFE